ncbi:hypothetical protein P0Y35_00505 [Kiritimatiellaeota bacterium B1221]|nr:hypothetical protein [Kiritimatiellaeota bacterium B1221]
MKNKNRDLGRWFIGFGIFLFVCGLLGYASNPLAAKTALKSGGGFGFISAAWGIWMLKSERNAPYIAATVTTLILCAAFLWRSTVTWQAVMHGKPKLFAAVLISSMLVASLISLFRLLRRLTSQPLYDSAVDRHEADISE